MYAWANALDLASPSCLSAVVSEDNFAGPT